MSGGRTSLSNLPQATSPQHSETGSVNVHLTMQALETTLANILTVIGSLQNNFSRLLGNATPKYYDSAASTNATSVSTTACVLTNIVVVNTTATAYYLKIYNKASAPTVGTDVPVQTFVVRANTTDGGLTQILLPQPITLSLGLGFGLTAGVAGTDTAAAVTGIGINLGYRT